MCYPSPDILSLFSIDGNQCLLHCLSLYVYNCICLRALVKPAPFCSHCTQSASKLCPKSCLRTPAVEFFPSRVSVRRFPSTKELPADLWLADILQSARISSLVVCKPFFVGASWSHMLFGAKTAQGKFLTGIREATAVQWNYKRLQLKKRILKCTHCVSRFHYIPRSFLENEWFFRGDNTPT